MAVALSLLCELIPPNLCLVSESGRVQDTPRPGFDPRSTINVHPYSFCILIVRRGYTLIMSTTFDLRKTFYRSSSLQTCRPPKTPNLMHSGPGCGFIALELTRAFDRYVGRGGGGGTKKSWGIHYKHTVQYCLPPNSIHRWSWCVTFLKPPIYKFQCIELRMYIATIPTWRISGVKNSSSFVAGKIRILQYSSDHIWYVSTNKTCTVIAWDIHLIIISSWLFLI